MQFMSRSRGLLHWSDPVLFVHIFAHKLEYYTIQRTARTSVVGLDLGCLVSYRSIDGSKPISKLYILEASFLAKINPSVCTPQK